MIFIFFFSLFYTTATIYEFLAKKFRNYKYTHKNDEKNKSVRRSKKARTSEKRSSVQNANTAQRKTNEKRSSVQNASTAQPNTNEKQSNVQNASTAQQKTNEKRSSVRNASTDQRKTDKKRSNVQIGSSAQAQLQTIDKRLGAGSKKTALESNKSNTGTNENNNTKFLPNKESMFHLNYLKSVVMKNTTIECIKSKLIATIEVRKKLVKNKLWDFLENFSIFFTNPELVKFEFDNTF